VVDGWAWLTSITLAAIGRPSKNARMMSASLFRVGHRHLSANVNRRLSGMYSINADGLAKQAAMILLTLNQCYDSV